MKLHIITQLHEIGLHYYFMKNIKLLRQVVRVDHLILCKVVMCVVKVWKFHVLHFRSFRIVPKPNMAA